MATQPPAPPISVADKPQNPASEVAQPLTDNQDVKADVTKENQAASVFVNSEPIREDQVQNAVKFLSHPKVKGSPVMYRRSFLERKGLTKEEIDEAFRRVPDSAPTVSPTQPAVANQEGQLQPSSNVQQQAPSQVMQPIPAAPVGTVSKLGTLNASRFHWSHALLAIGFLAVSGAGTAILFKNAIVPRLKSWIRKVVSEEEESLAPKTNLKPSVAEEAAAAAKSAAAAAADVARASQEMLISKTEEKRYFGELMSLLDVQVQEMKSMSNAIRKLEGIREVASGSNTKNGQSRLSGQERNTVPITSSKPSYANGKTDYDLQSERSLSPPASVEPAAAPHPKSYMEIMAMIQRGEKPSNIREINDLPPNPDQPVSNPRLAPRPKPWEVAQPQNSSPISQTLDGNGHMNHLNGDNSTSTPWWQQQEQQKSVRISEIETEEESRTRNSGITYNERPIPRSWVPPQPPPVVMAEAAAAIRQPKKSPFQKEQLTDDQFLARSTELSDELQRITKISEAGGATEANGGNSSSIMETSEIQKVDDSSYVEA